VWRQYNLRVQWAPLTLPLDYAAIERILPHRIPFLLVDRITEFEVDKRIVGVKNVSLNEASLTRTKGSPVLPPTILAEAVAQVGGILILAKPENRQRLPSSRHRTGPLPASRLSGDIVEIEAIVLRWIPLRPSKVSVGSTER
jgi:3-hydroxymyristoyl/3-hydroxydecanoyl-(acyl carrier protein) dehydratase